MIGRKKLLQPLFLRGAVAVLLVLSSVPGEATPPPNYPVDAFDEISACMQTPGCLKPEDRVDGDIALAAELTYRNPVCVEEVPCIIVCNTHACWCEADETCE
mgnify:CR=1 FL=1|tara:strand:+ start:806 stop:1111 length:306 start_codon:yes stop_codon:yes gene_type:complete